MDQSRSVSTVMAVLVSPLRSPRNNFFFEKFPHGIIDHYYRIGNYKRNYYRTGNYKRNYYRTGNSKQIITAGSKRISGDASSP